MDVKICIKGDLEHNKRYQSRTYVHRPTTNPLPYTTKFIQNICPFLIGVLSRKKTVNTKDIEL